MEGVHLGSQAHTVAVSFRKAWQSIKKYSNLDGTLTKETEQQSKLTCLARLGIQHQIAQQNRMTELVSELLLELWYSHRITTQTEAAEYLLQQLINSTVGSFIIYASAMPKEYALSVVSDCCGGTGTRAVKHFRIHGESGRYYINEQRRFASLQDLVAFYSCGERQEEEEGSLYLTRPYQQ